MAATALQVQKSGNPMSAGTRVEWLHPGQYAELRFQVREFRYQGQFRVQSPDVLKVGHHGSAYGTTQGFLRAVDPGAAIVSVGRDNLFGHPSPITIATLAAANVRTYRTDRDGAITIRSDGSSYAIDAFLQRSGHQ